MEYRSKSHLQVFVVEYRKVLTHSRRVEERRRTSFSSECESDDGYVRDWTWKAMLHHFRYLMK